MDLITRVRQYCIARQISIAELERLASLSAGSISKWHTSTPSVDKVNAVASVLGVSLDDLCGNQCDPSQDQTIQLIQRFRLARPERAEQLDRIIIAYIESEFDKTDQ